MNDCMAVRANRTKICNWVNSVLGLYAAYGHHVVNLNHARADGAIPCFEIEATDCTSQAVMAYACCACSSTSFVCIDGHGTNCALKVVLWLCHFFRQSR